MLQMPWATAGWGAFVVLHAHAASMTLALPALLLGLCLAGLLGQVDLARAPSALEFGVAGFGVVWLLAAVLADVPERALALSVPTLIAVVCAIVLPRAEESRPGVAFKISVGVLTALGLHACLAIVLRLPEPHPERLVELAAIPWLVVPNDLAWLGCLWPLWWRWSRSASRPTAGLLVVLGLSVLLVLALLVLQSRLGMLVLAVAVALELMGRRHRLAAGFAFAAVVLALLLASLTGKGLASGGARLQLWQAAWALFEANPWLGVGPHGFVMAYPEVLQGASLIDPRLTPWPHSLPLELLCSGGLLLGLVSVIVCILRFRAPSEGMPAAMGVSFLLVCLFEASTLRVWLWLWCVLMLLPPPARYTTAPMRRND
ncbi:O-antigen ligase like membrane protein [Aquimonas voraii]|uniref:O-antigen ligase like membrane protein n=1 Tax=Aquimonas voraii TaxID=265719 RepID=A0A1G6V0L4_9GAMM|nr:O-antigen ligase like membrane protein [Aquimonas voraii]